MRPAPPAGRQARAGLRRFLVLGVGLLLLGLVAWGTWSATLRSGMMGGIVPRFASVEVGDQGELSLEQAVAVVQRYLDRLGNPDLVLAEVMAFDNHFYAAVAERHSGWGAFELLVDRASGQVAPEPGPNMMWNERYGHMRSGWLGRKASSMPVTLEQARQLAQRFLDQAMPGTTAAAEVDAFYGYYTLHVLKNGRVVGMLSVHGQTGQVWWHSWHGAFLGMKSFAEDERR